MGMPLFGGDSLEKKISTITANLSEVQTLCYPLDKSGSTYIRGLELALKIDDKELRREVHSLVSNLKGESDRCQKAYDELAVIIEQVRSLVEKKD